MLVLNRKSGETVTVTVPPSSEPTRVQVTLVDIRHGKARIGFAAPKSVAIHRQEVQDQIDLGITHEVGGEG